MKKENKGNALIRWGDKIEEERKINYEEFITNFPKLDITEPSREYLNQQLVEIDTAMIPAPVVEESKHSLQVEGVDRFGHNLLELIDQTIEVVTTFGPVVGILAAAKQDYLVLVDTSSTVVFVPYRRIEYISFI